MTTTIEQTRKYDYSDFMIWFGIMIMVLWVIGKLSGYMIPPERVSTIPVMGAIVTIVGISIQALFLKRKMQAQTRKTYRFACH